MCSLWLWLPYFIAFSFPVTLSFPLTFTFCQHASTVVCADNLVHIVHLFSYSSVNFVVECVLFLHSFAIAILLSKAFPVQTNFSSADFILVLYVASKDIYQLQHTPLSLCQWRQPIQKLWSFTLAFCVLRMLHWIIFKNWLYCPLIVYNMPENGCKVLFIQCSTFTYFRKHGVHSIEVVVVGHTY